MHAEARFPEGPNSRLVNLMTIARHDITAENNNAVIEELWHGRAMLLVPAEPMKKNAPPGSKGVTFTHAPVIEGKVTLFAFTCEAAVLSFVKEDTQCMGFPSGELLTYCLSNGIGAVVVDPNTPNEVYLGLTPKP